MYKIYEIYIYICVHNNKVYLSSSDQKHSWADWLRRGHLFEPQRRLKLWLCFLVYLRLTGGAWWSYGHILASRHVGMPSQPYGRIQTWFEPYLNKSAKYWNQYFSSSCIKNKGAKYWNQFSVFFKFMHQNEHRWQVKARWCNYLQPKPSGKLRVVTWTVLILLCLMLYFQWNRYDPLRGRKVFPSIFPNRERSFVVTDQETL